MFNTATSYLTLLQEDDPQLKAIAIDKLDMLIDEHWSEISDYIKTFKTFYTNNEIPSHHLKIALILSKLYYHLEDYESAINWALESGDYFNSAEKSLYKTTLLQKILDKYISLKKQKFFAKEGENVIIEEKIQNIIDNIFNQCLRNKEVFQAIDFCLESYDIKRLSNAVESTPNVIDNLKFLYQMADDFIINKEYKSAIFDEILKLYMKHAGEQYMDITNCQFLLDNTEDLSATLLNILMKENDPSIAYQIGFDLYENQNNTYIQKIITEIKKRNEDKKISEEKLNPLLKILSGEIERELCCEALKGMNNTDNKIIDNLIKNAEKGGNVVHLGIILCNSLLNSHTGDDNFFKKNTQWISRATNWARFQATSCLGVVHMNNTKKGMDIVKPYLPGNPAMPSIYSQGGAFFGLGLIYAGTNDLDIKKFLLEAIAKPSNNKEPIHHGISLALGLVAMGTHDMELYARLLDGIYTDDAIIGEASAYAIGLIMVGSKNEQAIDDLLKYVHDTQHEKIIRASSLALALIVYGAEENANALIDQLLLEKDPILRYGAMYCIGMAYAGTGSTEMLRKLLKVSVSDVSDDVRRAALINIGFLQIKNPNILFEKLKVLNLLSESYNAYVRYGAVMAIGISCASTANLTAFKLIEPLMLDPSYLVRQAVLIATGLIFPQTTIAGEPQIKSFKEGVGKILLDKDEHVLIRFGACLCQGLIELGGRNCQINFVNNTGSNKMTSIISMAYFTQYFYWFPMIQFIHLAVNPSLLIGVDNNLKIVKGYQMKSNAKPSLFAYPKEEEIQKKKEVVKQEAAVLSTHNRVKAKEKKTGTVTNTDLKPAASGPIPTEEEKKEEKKEEEKKEEEKKPEPNDEILNNPIRILPRQREVMEEIQGQKVEPIVHGRVNGFILLKNNSNDPLEYEDFKKVEIVEEKKEEEKKEEEKKDDYQPVNNFEIPDEIDITNL
ncbi:MAG: HEAT repeat domain-containing protein [archaeon]|nr:HEAT repeat domain-containing protein [archaeon]